MTGPTLILTVEKETVSSAYRPTKPSMGKEPGEAEDV